MREAFLEYLFDSGVVAESPAVLRKYLRGVPEPLGSLAFQYGIMYGGDVDLVLARQRDDIRQFGEIAIDLGILTPAQLRSLLRVQQIRQAVEVAEALTLAGYIDEEVVLDMFACFLLERNGIDSHVGGAS